MITTPFTFVSTTHAIVRNGLTPVFCDINPVDFTMDVSKIESLITEKTCAIMYKDNSTKYTFYIECDFETAKEFVKTIK